MLQLLLEGGEDFGDLAALLGVPEDEVRRRATAALAAIGGPQGDSASALGDLFLGGLDAEGAERVRARLRDRPSELAAARRLHARLRLLFPAASLPELPSPGAGAAPAPAAPVIEPPMPERAPAADRASEASADAAPVEPEPVEPEPVASEPEPVEPDAADPDPTAAPEDRDPAPQPPTLTSQQKRLLALLSALGLAVVIVVLGIAGVFDSGEPAGDGDAETTTAQSGDTRLTRAVLRPQDGSDAAGVAIFGAVDESTPVLQVTAEDLRPTGAGEEYSVWLDGDVPAALRLAGVEVARNGRIATQIELPAEVLGFVVEGGFDRIDISRNRKSAYRREMNAAERQGRPTRRIGTSVLRGPITGPGIGSSSDDG